MRLRKEMIELIACNLVKSLLDDGFIIFHGKREILEKNLANVIEKDLMIEDKLNLEVKDLMREYIEKTNIANVDYGRVFQMIKQKLVRERGLII